MNSIYFLKTQNEVDESSLIKLSFQSSVFYFILLLIDNLSLKAIIARFLTIFSAPFGKLWLFAERFSAHKTKSRAESLNLWTAKAIIERQKKTLIVNSIKANRKQKILIVCLALLSIFLLTKSEENNTERHRRAGSDSARSFNGLADKFQENNLFISARAQRSKI